MFVAHVDEQYLGHAKLVWHPGYPPFRKAGIPEIQDPPGPPRRRTHVLGTTLITTCEDLARPRSDTIGIGVGLHPGYNAAQKLYSKIGYVLDGNGVHYDHLPVREREFYRFDDKLIIYFTKRLR